MDNEIVEHSFNAHRVMGDISKIIKLEKLEKKAFDLVISTLYYSSMI